MSSDIPAPAPAVERRRRRTPRLIAAMAGVIFGGWCAWSWWHRGRESTDDAQVEGRIISVASRVSGQVAKVLVIDNQIVAPGDLLVELDAEEYQAKLDAAKADVAAA